MTSYIEYLTPRIQGRVEGLRPQNTGPHFSENYNVWNLAVTNDATKVETSASVKNWCISPHGIVGFLDQSSPISGNRCRLARPLTPPNFVALRQEAWEISAVENFCRSKKWTKVHQNPLRPATHQSPSLRQISSLSTKRCARKTLQIFIHPSVFWLPRETPERKFTSLSPDIDQGPLYQSAKFHPVLTTRLGDSCCQILSISLTPWPTKKQ